MVRLAIIVGVIAVVFMIYAFIDSLMTDRFRVRALPKPVWVIITIIPIIGGFLWLTLGKDRSRGHRSGAPDDDPDFLRTIGSDKERDARIRDLEARLAELDDDHDDPAKS
jgi:hypothetical protein